MKTTDKHKPDNTRVDTDNPAVSIIMPVYRENPEQLKSSIQSVIQQTYPRFQVYLILDPGCTRQVEEDVCAFSDHPKVHVLHNSIRGAGSHRNLAVSRSFDSTDFFAFIDADCQADSRWLQQLVTSMLKQPENVGCVGGVNLANETRLVARAIACAESCFMGGGGVSGQTTIQTRERFVNSVPNCNALYRKECWDTGRQNEAFIKGQDGEFNLRLSLLGWRFVQIPEARVIHKRSDTLTAYTVRMFAYGKAACETVRRHGFAGLKRYWYGVLATLCFSSAAVLTLLSLVHPRPRRLWKSLAAIYLSALIAATLSEIRRNDPAAVLLSLPVMILQHITYATGFLTGLFTCPGTNGNCASRPEHTGCD